MWIAKGALDEIAAFRNILAMAPPSAASGVT
jgi:hypothetical protein